MDKWLNHPTIVKLVALGLGILMWAVVHFDPDSTPNNVSSLVETKVINSVKIQPYGLDERSFVLNNLAPQTVKLTVSGSRSDLLAAPESYEVRLDLRTVGEGTHTMKLQYDLPRGIQFVEMTPSSVSVSIQALETKEFEVDITTSGSPAKGYKAGTPIVKPSNRVHVTLPKNEIAEVHRVGALISVEGAKETLKNKSVKLEAFDEAGKVIKNVIIEPAILEVEIPITNPFKTVPLQFRLVGRVPAGLSIESFKPDVEQVTLYGPQEELDKLEFLNVDVQLTNVKNSGKLAVTLQIEAPIIEVSPKQIEISIVVVLSATRSLEGLPIIWNGLGEGLIVKFVEPSTGKADITIQGAPAILDRLQPGDVDVIADLIGRGPGTHTIPLIVNLERFMEQVGGTNSITVEITNDVPAAAPEEEGDEGVVVE
ncbi:YbbR-like domain-containing protein [Cohnella sp.]|uniref:CdaR family protein n=1 Tax=Cohnella sp. TaxID=1883426 RepID=UPI003567BB7C